MEEQNKVLEEIANEEQDKKARWAGISLLAGVGVIGYIIGSKIGYDNGLAFATRNPIVKSIAETIEYNEAGQAVAKTLTKTFGIK